jgi:endoglucanase
MLMAVSEGNREEFDKVWRWTKEHLQTRGDSLFSWLWENGKIADMNSATDADQDIATALILASKEWQDKSYSDEALKVIRDIWDKDTAQAGGVKYITAGDWVLRDQTGLTLNPSYFSPYEYRLFAQIDPGHDWNALIDSSYAALLLCTDESGLPADWCRLDRSGNPLPRFSINGKDSDLFSYDALRVPYRLAMDYRINGEKRAWEFLEKMSFFDNEWGRKGKIFAVYRASGSPGADFESGASYGTQLARFSVIKPYFADQIIKQKILMQNISTAEFYDLSWIWFGLDFHGSSKLSNLFLKNK